MGVPTARPVRVKELPVIKQQNACTACVQPESQVKRNRLGQESSPVSPVHLFDFAIYVTSTLICMWNAESATES